MPLFRLYLGVLSPIRLALLPEDGATVIQAGPSTVPVLPPRYAPTATIRQRQEATPMQDDYRELRRRLGAAGLLDPQPRAYLRHLAIALGLLVRSLDMVDNSGSP
jgi:hypothetical protein